MIQLSAPAQMLLDHQPGDDHDNEGVTCSCGARLTHPEFIEHVAGLVVQASASRCDYVCQTCNPAAGDGL